MAELTIDWTPVIDRMKAEGKLTRNSGTNSIKAVKEGIADMTGALESIGRSLVMQSSFLESAYNINADMYEMERERARDAARLARLNEPNEPAAPEPEESGSGDDDTDDGKKGKGKNEGFLKSLFSASAFKKAAIAAVAGPFIYGFLKGSIDQLTGGKFTEFEKIVVEKLPDLFESIKTSIAHIYDNITTFLETGNLEDLLKDTEGNPIIDLEKLEKAAYKFAPYAIGYLLGGPLGLVGVAISDGLLSALEKVTGPLDDYISPEARAALVTMTGLTLGSALTSPIVGGLIRTAFVGLFTNPFGIAALAVAAGITALFAAAKSGRKRVENLNNEIQDMADEYEQAIKDGDFEKADKLESKIASEVKRTNQLAPQNDEGRIAILNAQSRVGRLALEQDLANRGSNTFFDEDKDALNERVGNLTSYAAALKGATTEEQRTEILKNIAALIPDAYRRDIAKFDPDNAFQSSNTANRILNSLGVGMNLADALDEQLGGYLNTIMQERITLMDSDDFLQSIQNADFAKASQFKRDYLDQGLDREDMKNRKARQDFDKLKRAYDRYTENFSQFYNMDGTLKTDIIATLSDELKQLAAERGFLVNNGGNTFVGGSTANQSTIQYNFSTTGLPAQALADSHHQ